MFIIVTDRQQSWNDNKQAAPFLRVKFTYSSWLSCWLQLCEFWLYDEQLNYLRLYNFWLYDALTTLQLARLYSCLINQSHLINPSCTISPSHPINLSCLIDPSCLINPLYPTIPFLHITNNLLNVILMLIKKVSVSKL